MTSDDQLQHFVEELTRSAKESGIELFHGWIDDWKGSALRLELDDSRHRDASALIQQAKSTGARFAFVCINHLEAAELDDAMSTLREAEESPETDRVRNTLNDCKGRIGWVSSIDFGFVIPGSSVLPYLEIRPPWFDEVYDTAAVLAGEEEIEDEQCTDEETEGLAKELANQPRFQAAKNQDARALETRKFLRGWFPDGCAVSYAQEIMQTAKSIYETEILPAVNRQLREKAEHLFSQGLQNGQVAREMGITMYQLRKLL